MEIVCFASGRSKLLVTTGVFGRAALRDEGLDEDLDIVNAAVCDGAMKRARARTAVVDSAASEIYD